MRLRWGLLALFVLAGCGTVGVGMTVRWPAEVDLRPYPRIAVAGVDGNFGQMLADRMRAQLGASGLFEVLDLSSQPPSVRARPGLALVHGRLDGTYAEHLAAEETQCGPKEKRYACVRFTRTGSARTNGTVDVVDGAAGRILLTRLLGASCQAETEAIDAYPAPINVPRLFDACLNQNIADVTRAMLPRNETLTVYFVTNDAFPEVTRAIGHARAGELAEAARLFEEAARSAESLAGVKRETVAGFYRNVGLARAFGGEFDGAVEAFRRAYAIVPDDRYLSDIHVVDQLRAAAERLAPLPPPAR